MCRNYLKASTMNNTRVLYLLATSLLLSGCTSLQKSSFQDMSAAYREVVEKYSNDNILLNIVRSSQNMPMSFLDIPVVTGSGNWSVNAGSNRTLYDFAYTSNGFNHSLGVGVNNGFTFQQTSLDNAQFMTAFYKEIDLESVNFRGTEQRLPKELIYTLLIDSIELRTQDNVQIHQWMNDPMQPGYSAFQSALRILVDIGLTTEVVSYKSPIGPPLAGKALKENLASWSSAVANNKSVGIEFDPITVEDVPHYQLFSWKQYTRFCVNGYSATVLLGNSLAQTAYCADSPQVKIAPKDRTQSIQSFIAGQSPSQGNLQLRIKLRSRGNIFDYLGSVLRAQHAAQPYVVTILKNPDQDEAIALFKVHKNSPQTPSVMSVTYKGVHYGISDDDQAYTKQVMEFMSTSINLAKIPGAIPAPSPIIIR
jgi:hypothetical protein